MQTAFERFNQCFPEGGKREGYIMEKELTRKQFDLLNALATVSETLSQRRMEEETGYSLGTINKTVKELTEKGLLANGKITPEG